MTKPRQKETKYKTAWKLAKIHTTRFGKSYLAEQFRQIKHSLAEQFRQTKHSLAKQFREIKRTLAEQFRQIKRSLAEQFRKIKCSLAEPQYVVEARAKMSLAIMSKILASGCTN